MERDEWLRAAWRVLISEEVDSKRLVFVDEMGANICLSFLCMPGPREEKEPLLGTS
jgi:hypothetical protein